MLGQRIPKPFWPKPSLIKLRSGWLRRLARLLGLRL